MAKRYLLYLADSDLDEGDLRQLASILEGRHGRLKVIAVRGTGRAAIVKTTADTVSSMRERSAVISLSEKKLTAALTSGGIGKLKRRALEERDDADWQSS